MQNWLMYSLMALVLWGFYAFFPKLAVPHVAPVNVLFYQMVGGAVVGIAAMLVMGFNLGWHPQGSLFGFLTGVCGLAGALFYILAMRSGNVSTIATLTALYPLITILLSVMILHEPFTLKQGIGVVFAVAALVMFSI